VTGGHLVGIEIGGTKLQAGVGTADGRLLGLARDRIDPGAGAGAIRDRLPSLVAEATRAAGVAGRPAGIGVGFGGPVNARQGRVLLSVHVEGWRDFPLAAWAESLWGVPVCVSNDAAAAAVAEAHLGAGRGKGRIFYVTVGSGVGGCLVVDGRPDHGQGSGAGEIGHTLVPNPDATGVVELEGVASGWALQRRARHVRRSWPAVIRGEDVAAAAAEGDAGALRVIEQGADALATGLANVVALLHPELIVVGGGVSLMGPLFWRPLRERFRERTFAPFAAAVDVVPAALGEAVVVHGALLLGTRAAERRPSAHAAVPAGVPPGQAEV
jgi:glucokinase